MNSVQPVGSWAKDHLALETVWLNGHPFIVVDIGLRMLTLRELRRALSCPDNYQQTRANLLNQKTLEAS